MSALTDVFSNIANAIRTKTGGSDTYTPYQMPDAITNIPAGGGGYDGVIAININGEYMTGNLGPIAVGSFLALDVPNAPNNIALPCDIDIGDDVFAEYGFVNAFSLQTLFGYTDFSMRQYGSLILGYTCNLAGHNFYMPRKMKSAEFMLGNISYWPRESLPNFVFRGNTDIRGIFCGIPSWGGFQVNVYHPNIEDYISTNPNNSLFGSANKPFSGWGSFSWTKVNDNYYRCSEFNVALIRYTE